MLNVAYDISILGISYREKNIFGISRTTEELLISLLDIPNLSLSACSDLSFNVWLNSNHYFNQGDFNGSLSWLTDYPRNKLKAGLDDLLSRAISHLNDHNIIKSGYTLNKWRSKFSEFKFRGVSPKSLSNIDLYHSPYYPIPESVKYQSRIKQVLTVHDIIPILYPEFCGLIPGSNQQFFHPEFDLPKTLKTINPDMWITCPSQTTKNDLCEYLGHNVDADKIAVVPWAASNLFYECKDANKSSLVKQKYKITDEKYILSLNTLEPRKNIDHLIRCFVDLVTQEKISDLSLVLSGRLGWQYDSILHEVRKNSALAKKIILTGYIADDDLAALYSNAMVFVYPSFYEGFGLPPLEAMQCGTPVITSNISSLPEVVGDAGIVVNPRDQAALCQSLLKIYQSSSLQADLSQRSLARAKQFSWQTCAQQTMSVYQQALR